MEAARGGRKDGIQEKALKDGIIQKEAAKAKDGIQGDTVPKEKGKGCKEHATTVRSWSSSKIVCTADKVESWWTQPQGKRERQRHKRNVLDVWRDRTQIVGLHERQRTQPRGN